MTFHIEDLIHRQSTPKAPPQASQNGTYYQHDHWHPRQLHSGVRSISVKTKERDYYHAIKLHLKSHTNYDETYRAEKKYIWHSRNNAVRE